VRVKCLAEERNILIQARAQAQTAWSRDEHSNNQATAPLYLFRVLIWKLLSALYNLFCLIRFSKLSMNTPISTVECYPSYQGCGHSLVRIAVCSILSKSALVQHSTHDATPSHPYKLFAFVLAWINICHTVRENTSDSPIHKCYLIGLCSRKYWLLSQLAYGAAFASVPDWTAS